MTHPDQNADLDALLGRLRAADPLADPRWNALSEGALSEEEAAELKAACERGEAPAGAYEAFRPRSAERREKVLAAVLEPSRRVSPWRRRAWTACAGLALAAAVALAVKLRSPPPLPAYALSFEGGDTLRATPSARPAGPPGTLHLRADGRARMVLLPATAVRGKIDVRAFVVVEREVVPWEAGAQVTREGAVEIAEVSAPRLRQVLAKRLQGLPAPELDLVLAVARVDRLPADEVLRAAIAARAVDAGDAQLLRLHVILDEAPP